MSDKRVFASHALPAKVDLFNGEKRRESVIERQLEEPIAAPAPVPAIQVDHAGQFVQQASRQQQEMVSQLQYHQPQQQQYDQLPGQQQTHESITQTTSFTQTAFPTAVSPGPSTRTNVVSPNPLVNLMMTKKETQAAELAAELADKEHKLMADITALHQRPYSPYQVPSKVDLSNEQRIIQQQQHAAYLSTQGGRPVSRASSTRSANTAADLAENEAKLMREIEEIERKPYRPQTMVLEREQWYEYPLDRPTERQLVESNLRIRDSINLPRHLYTPDGHAHIHEDNLPAKQRPSSAIGSVHTTIIRSPRREVDNKSPLPFAFDNFSTKGVRGNIASACAVEPERPRPPIYPTVRRSPTNLTRV